MYLTSYNLVSWCSDIGFDDMSDDVKTYMVDKSTKYTGYLMTLINTIAIIESLIDKVETYKLFVLLNILRYNIISWIWLCRQHLLRRQISTWKMLERVRRRNLMFIVITWLKQWVLVSFFIILICIIIKINNLLYKPFKWKTLVANYIHFSLDV